MRFVGPVTRGYTKLAVACHVWTARGRQPLRKCCALALFALVVAVPFLVVVELEYLSGGQLFILGSGSPQLLVQPARSGRNVFFIESSCVVGARGRFGQPSTTAAVFNLNNRQACAVESAARAYPDHAVYVLHTCPSVGLQLWSDASRHAVDYPNVRLVELDPLGFFSGTPLQTWAASGRLETSRYPVVHASDVFRLLALWKYGGLYLDLDVISFRNTGGLENFVVLERNSSLNNAVLHLSPDGLGHQVASELLADIARDFRGDSWNYNGPQLVTRTLLRRCNVSKPRELNKERCSGFTVLDIPAFYPLTYEQWYWVFDEGRTEEVRRIIGDSYGLHMWNSISSTHHRAVSTKATLSLLVQQYCPRVFNNSDRLL